jgi:hypothetical protein
MAASRYHCLVVRLEIFGRLARIATAETWRLHTITFGMYTWQKLQGQCHETKAFSMNCDGASLDDIAHLSTAQLSSACKHFFIAAIARHRKAATTGELLMDGAAGAGRDPTAKTVLGKNRAVMLELQASSETQRSVGDEMSDVGQETEVQHRRTRR